jgi:5'(3')-deoxyribonucleotidase
MKKIIAIDIDDVIADSTDALRLVVNERLGVDLQVEHYRIPGKYWGYYEQVWIQHNIADKLSMEELDREFIVQDQSHIMPKTGAIETLRRLNESYDIVLVTARDQRAEVVTRRWLNQHLPSIYKDLHIIGNYKTTAKPRSKGQVCRDIGASWLIDDNPQHCLSAIEYGVDGLLFGEYGWHHGAPDHLIVCKDWTAIEDYFDGKS